ncbi:MAG: pectate lyase, partial [Prevotella sp.]|nr:pectate lyase [Prevotella sp.]
MEVQLNNGDIKYYNTKNLSSVNINKEAATVTLVNGDGENDVYYGNVKHIGFTKKAESGQEGDIIDNGITITECKGWHESCYIEWTPISNAKSYNVYVKGGNYANFTKIDGPLVRNYGTYGRADMVGLIAGTYSMKVVGVDADGNELSANGVANNLQVINYKREGFAFLNWNAGVGAYKNDGSLKSGARIIYVTAATAKTITCNVVTGDKGEVTACTGLQAIIAAYEKGSDKTPTAFRIIGTINADDMDSFGSSAEGLQIKGRNADSELNITLEGIGEDATIKGFGFLIRNAKSLELRNFAIMNFMDDGVSMDTDNSNIWVHHLDVFYGKKGSAADQVKGDGSIDIKSDSKYITVSYCHFWDAGKSSLCGMKSESGPNYISYDHNWFDHSDSRHPRIRTMTVHVWNNYYDGNSKYGVGAAMNSNAFVESNYFRNCKFPMLSSLQGNDVYAGTNTYNKDYGTFSGEQGGVIKSFGNVITGSQSSYWAYGATNILCKGTTKSASSMGIDTKTHFDAYEATSRNEIVPSNVKAFGGGRTYDNFDTNSSLMYSYTPDAAADIPAKVVGYYGAGRLNHGDFKWTFSDSEDTNSEVIAALRTAIINYTSTLVGIYGDANQQGTGGGEGGNDNPDNPDDPTPGTDISSDVECNFQNSAPS